MNVFFEARRRLHDTLKNKTLLDTTIYMAGNLLAQGIGFFVLPIFTRYLSPEDYGIFNYTNSIMPFLAIFSYLSLNSFVLRHYFTLSSEEDRRRLFGSIYLFIALQSALLLALEFLILPLVIQRFSIQIPFHPFFELAVICNFLEMLMVIPLASLRVKKQAGHFFLVTAGQSIASVLIGLFLVAGGGWGLTGRYTGILITDILFAGVGAVIMMRRSDFALDFSMITKGFRFSLPLLPATLTGMGMAFSDRIILERYVPLADIGIYSVAVVLGTVIVTLAMAFYRAVEPDIFASYHRPGFKEWVVRLKDRFLLPLIFLGCLQIIFARELTSLMVSRRFEACYPLIPLLVLASIFRGAKVLVGVSFHAYNKTIYDPLIGGIGCVASVATNLLLIPIYGITGAALASIVTYWVLLVTTTTFSERFVGIRWGVWKDTLIVAAAWFLSFGVMKINLGGMPLTVAAKIAVIGSTAVVVWMAVRRPLAQRGR